MGNEKINNLLLQVGSLLKSYDKIAKATGENFNIFTVMGMESNEVKTHSAIIGELLNPKGSHGMEDKLLKHFIKIVIAPLYENKKEEFENKFNFKFESTKCHLEDFAGKISDDKTEGGRMDIVIKDDGDKVFLIENKINAGEQINQILRYKNFYPNAPILFLTLRGDDAESAQTLEKNIDYFTISYEQNIIPWLEECLKETVKHAMLREVLSQYINLIKKLTHQTLNNELKMEISELIKNNFSSALEITNNYNSVKKEVIDLFWDKLKLSIQEKLVNKYWIVKQDLRLISKYNHLLFSLNENDNAFLYYRFHIIDGVVECGIILKEGKGKDVFQKIDSKLYHSGFISSSYQSVIWKKDDEFDFSDPEQLTKMNNDIAFDENNQLNKLSDKVVKFINENEKLYKSILEDNLIQKTN